MDNTSSPNSLKKWNHIYSSKSTGSLLQGQISASFPESQIATNTSEKRHVRRETGGKFCSSSVKVSELKESTAHLTQISTNDFIL